MTGIVRLMWLAEFQGFRKHGSLREFELELVLGELE